MNTSSKQTPNNLHELGWKPFFQQQLSLEELESYQPARVSAQHRSLLELLSPQGSYQLQIQSSMPTMTVGDWVLLDASGHFYRLLDRSTLFTRKAAGTKVDTQLIAANIDLVLILSSLNDDFNLNRIERYLSLSQAAGSDSMVVLTKADCCDDPSQFISQVQGLDPLLEVVALNCLDQDSMVQLRSYLEPGKTLAFLGSSGVGKSTLVNSLMNESAQATGSIREDDSKGRHTTTSRSLHLLSNGPVIIDTPGMRELQLVDCEEGIEQTFHEIYELAKSCRFSDCQHESEPGCAVIKAIEMGELDSRRVQNFKKLLREQAFNSASLAEKRARDKQFGKMVRSVMSEVKNRKQR